MCSTTTMTTTKKKRFVNGKLWLCRECSMETKQKSREETPSKKKLIHYALILIKLIEVITVQTVADGWMTTAVNLTTQSPINDSDRQQTMSSRLTIFSHLSLSVSLDMKHHNNVITFWSGMEKQMNEHTTNCSINVNNSRRGWTTGWEEEINVNGNLTVELLCTAIW